MKPGMPDHVTLIQPPRLFANVQGRDVSADRRPGFDVAHAYYEHRKVIAEDLGILRSLIDATNALYDLAPAQWAQWYGVVLGFKPDLIVELGRSKGNSTALFCQAASRLGATRVVSLCNSKDWVEESLPRIKAVVPTGWLDRLDARTTDILDVDYERLFEGAQRVLLLWDAHGFEIAEVVLGRILPLIADRPHLVLMHDISDNRYAEVSRSYEGQAIWKGSSWDKGTGTSLARVNIGWMSSLQDQVVAVADFAARNDIDVESADHEYAKYFVAYAKYAEMQRALGDEFFSQSAHWAFFSLAGRQPPFYFPAIARRFRHECPVVVRDIHPKPRWWRTTAPLPRTVHTAAIKWDYALVLAWKPAAEIPVDANRSLRLRVQVQHAPAGIGLLNADRMVFVESQRLLPGIESQTVFLPVRDPSGVGPLVVHAWDAPEPAQVRIDGLSLVW